MHVMCFRESAVPVDMKPLPKEPEDEKKKKQKTPKSMTHYLIMGSLCSSIFWCDNGSDR